MEKKKENVNMNNDLFFPDNRNCKLSPEDATLCEGILMGKNT